VSAAMSFSGHADRLADRQAPSSRRKLPRADG
jgi:hypothetical protein